MIRLSYWVTPILAGAVWLATLLALLLYWAVSANQTHYGSMAASQHIAYISDVGASDLKPLFITGCVLTTVLLDLSLALDRWLRHRGRLAPNTTRGEKALSWLTILCAVVGTAGLILLSVFDTARHPQLHNIFLLFFIAGYVLSAVFICWEYQRLGMRYREHRVLRLSFYIKLVFVIVEILLAIAFASCTFTKHYNAGAVLEWVIAFIFSAYVFSFYVDLYPAAATKQQRQQQEQMSAMKNGAGGGGGRRKMRLTRGGRETPSTRRGEDDDVEEGGSDGALDAAAAADAPNGVASFEAARVGHGRRSRSESRTRVLASNF
ncbi:Frag1/DRAM/Sfk1 family-domain-containing protein [Chaetomidium leptoderma]|uniref:Frag1/DRAM/Sfk1 family-domain-containing protein n=1 Tax=Chaetomidium leptoderma TaxID=669021 RepID=A0AAN6VQ09_9PEZI|nr:Frag1/DRAM/Sfk1 family-domain-containing protein [Chaetomidium leptoderma]